MSFVLLLEIGESCLPPSFLDEGSGEVLPSFFHPVRHLSPGDLCPNDMVNPHLINPFPPLGPVPVLKRFINPYIDGLGQG